MRRGGLSQGDRLDDVRSLALLHQLNRMGPLVRGWTTVVKAEFQFVSEAIDREIPGRPGRKSRINGYMFQPERTRQAFAMFCRMMIGNGTRPYGEVQLSAGEPNPPEGVRKLLLLLRPNGMAGTVLPASDYLNRFLVGMYEAQSHLDGLRTILACRLYEIRNGRLPATLETLVPEYLPEVPRDPFDGKPFRYLRGQARVYSVGRDLKDSQVDNVGGRNVCREASRPAGRRSCLRHPSGCGAVVSEIVEPGPGRRILLISPLAFSRWSHS